MADYLEVAREKETIGSRIPMQAQATKNAIAPPPNRPLMEVALLAVEESEKKLADRLDLLQSRLRPVLQVRPQDAVNGKSISESCGAQIPDILFNHAGVLQAHVRQIQELLDTLAI